jgi:hypothetical protein
MQRFVLFSRPPPGLGLSQHRLRTELQKTGLRFAVVEDETHDN